MTVVICSRTKVEVHTKSHISSHPSFLPQRKGKSVEYVEEAYSVRNIQLKLRTDVSPVKSYLTPSKKTLKTKYRDGYTSCTVPEVLTPNGSFRTAKLGELLESSLGLSNYAWSFLWLLL